MSKHSRKNILKAVEGAFFTSPSNDGEVHFGLVFMWPLKVVMPLLVLLELQLGGYYGTPYIFNKDEGGVGNWGEVDFLLL